MKLARAGKPIPEDEIPPPVSIGGAKPPPPAAQPGPMMADDSAPLNDLNRRQLPPNIPASAPSNSGSSHPPPMPSMHQTPVVAPTRVAPEPPAQLFLPTTQQQP